MTIEELCAAALVPHLSAKGLEPAPFANGRLAVPELGLDILPSIVDVSDDRTSVTVVYEARDPGSDEPGIEVLAVGIGHDIETAAASAAEQWAVGVLPVLRSWSLGVHVCEVEQVPMVVAVDGSEERFGWTVHLGPVLGRAYGEPGSGPVSLGDLSRTAAFNPIFDVIHPLAAHADVLWVESFARRDFRKDETDATCRVNNEPFEPGRTALAEWASTWPACGAAHLSKRQFLLFEPTPLDQVDAAPDLERTLDREAAQRTRERDARSPWWKRFWTDSG